MPPGGTWTETCHGMEAGHPGLQVLDLMEVRKRLFPCLGLVSADKESAAHILSREGGSNLLSIVVGDIQESLDARPGAYKLVLRNHKGFIMLALMHGYQGEGS
ncbi:2-acylglycerol O-acyltransferase 2-like [Bos indicus x Bos taurus]|uniref:2-acylglycerol O-acyltransferase 2-like n=1 Tax=Bos indicus x Bos taurus TaxID=30522 RepID=UPI000F7D42FB|nr:2-acylglycerol O-acyltransferase 2-like [Bos indicus x Bos taurus]